MLKNHINIFFLRTQPKRALSTRWDWIQTHSLTLWLYKFISFLDLNNIICKSINVVLASAKADSNLSKLQVSPWFFSEIYPICIWFSWHRRVKTPSYLYGNSDSYRKNNVLEGLFYLNSKFAMDDISERWIGTISILRYLTGTWMAFTHGIRLVLPASILPYYYHAYYPCAMTQWEQRELILL